MNNNNNARFDKMEELNTSTVREVQRLASSLDNAIHVAVDAQNRAKHAESELHAVKQHPASVAPGKLDKVIRWYEDTRRADIDFEAISGNTFIQAPNNISATPETIANTLNTDKPVIQKMNRHNQPTNSFRVIVGPRGREGTIATNNFLPAAQHRAPPGYKVQREKTVLTIQREKAVRQINSAVRQVLSTQPTLQGLTTHIGSNGCSLFLSHANRKDAMDPTKADAPAFEYPVWDHVPYHKTMNNFRGGFDYQHTQHLEHTYILSRIQAALPNSPDTQMADASPQPTRPSRTTSQRPVTNNNTNSNNAINNSSIPI